MSATQQPDAQMKELLAANGIPARSIVAMRSGREHHLFKVVLRDGSMRIGKVPREDFRDPHWPDRVPMLALAAEAQAIAMLRDKVGDFPALPDPYQLLPGDPPGALMGVVAGRPPEATLFKHGIDHRTLSMVCVEMGRMLAEIHRVRRPEHPTTIPDLPGHDLEDARLLHMDFHLGNVLGNFQLGGVWKLVGIVDWTCAHWGPREADLGELGASVFATNPDLLDDFLVGYRQRSGLPLSRPKVLDVLVAELERRLRDDPPEEPRIYNLFVARIEEWTREL